MADLYQMILLFGFFLFLVVTWLMLSNIATCVGALTREGGTFNTSHKLLLREIQRELKEIERVVNVHKNPFEIDVYSYDANTGLWGNKLLGTFSMTAIPQIKSYISLGEDAGGEEIACLVAEVMYTKEGILCAVIITEAERATLND